MKKKILMYFLIIMVACTIAGRAISGISVARVVVEKSKADYIAHTVRSVGQIEKNAEEGVHTISGMIVKKIHVSIGDSVEKGATLLELDLEVLEEQLTVKQNELSKIQLQKDDVEKQKQVAAENRERAIRQAQDSYNQAVNSANAQVGQAEQAFEAARWQLENAGEISQEEWNALEADAIAKRDALEQAYIARDSEILGATQALESARANEATESRAESLQIDEEGTNKEIEKLEELKNKRGVVTASIDGVVTNILVGTGEQTGDTAIVLLADTSRGYRFVVDVTKEENKYLSKGQKVSLAPTNGGKAIKDLEIESIIASKEDAETMQVTIPVTADQFYIGESAEMLAVQSAKQYPACLPIAALVEENKEYFVYILETENAILGETTIVRKHKVDVLDKNETNVAIDNLNTNQEAVTSANKALQDGLRVRIEE